jgi:hypothetical protein
MKWRKRPWRVVPPGQWVYRVPIRCYADREAAIRAAQKLADQIGEAVEVQYVTSSSWSAVDHVVRVHPKRTAQAGQMV